MAAPKLKAFAQIFRMEYLPATAPGLLIPFFLCAKSPGEFLSVTVIEGLLVVMLMIYAGLGINAIADREIDRKYATSKNKIPDAIGLLGVRTAWTLVAIHILLACALTIHISISLGHWLPLALLVAEAFFGYGYSLKPLHFKVRGVFWHAIALSLSTQFIPFTLMAYVFIGRLSLPLVMFIAGFSLILYGWELCNQTVDYLEDRAEGLRTPAVRMGVVGTLATAMVLPIVGMCVECGGLYLLMARRGVTLVSPALTVSTPAVWVAAAAMIVLGNAVPLRGAWRMYLLSRTERPEVCVPKMPALCRFALWQATAVGGAAAAAGVYYLAANHGS